MKKTLLLALLVCSCAAAQAQNNTPLPDYKKNRIVVGGSLINLTNMQLRSYGSSAFSLSMLLGYERKLNRRWSLGFDYYLSTTGMLVETSNGNTGAIGVGQSSLLFKGRYSWHYKTLPNSSYRFYSGLGLGTYRAAIVADDGVNEPEIRTGFGLGYQVDLIGAEYVWDWFGFWGEFGFGRHGNLKAGVSFNFF